MSDFIFRINPNIILGPFTINRLGQYSQDWGTRFMIIMDPVLNELKLSEKILQPLRDRNIDFFVFSDLSEGSSSKNIERALKLAREGHVQGIICTGGEKAMNIGRTVAAYYNETQDLYTLIDGAAVTKEPIPCLCIPTTYRTPYIFTREVPVMDARSRQLKIIKIPYTVCKLLLVDPNLMLSLTDNQKITLSLEALNMGLEAYLSQKANFFSDMFAEKGLELLSYTMTENMEHSSTTPEEVLLSQAGCLVSMATSSASLGMISLLSLSIYTRYNINKSLISSILLPYFIEYVSKFKAAEIDKIAKIMGICDAETEQEESCRIFVDFIRELMAKENLPARLKDLKLTIEQLSLAIEDVAKFDIMNNLPRSMTSDDLFDFVKAAF